jgi:hypothetical protein
VAWERWRVRGLVAAKAKRKMLKALEKRFLSPRGRDCQLGFSFDRETGSEAGEREDGKAAREMAPVQMHLPLS